MNAILRRKEVQRLTGLPRSTLYHKLATDPKFPKPIKLSERAVGWLESEITAWVDSRVQKRDGEAA